MSETQTEAAPAKAKRTPPEVTPVVLNDGRTVNFTGKTKMNKEVERDGEGTPVAVRFEFRNGEVRRFDVTNSALIYELAAHGAKQKIGDQTAGEDDVDDMVVAVDAMLDRLNAGKWDAERKAGDGFSGASLVIRAIMEATGKSQADVKAFLDGKLAAAEASGQKLTRRELYDSFRNPASKTGQIIRRLEDEKKAKAAKFDADELVGELGAG